MFILLLLSTLYVNAQEVNKKELSNRIEDKHPLLSNQFTFYVGVYSSTKGIRIGVNGSSENEIIDFSEKTGFNDNEITLFLNFNWRFARMWTLSSEYFSIKNGISRSVDENFEWGDQIFNAGAGIKLGLSLSMYRIMVGRTITKGQKYELGVGLGAHTLDIKTYIEGEAYLNNENTGEGAEVSFERNSVNIVAPLPNIGTWFFYAPHNKWLLAARVDWFALSVGEYSGNMWNLGAGVNYQFHKNIGVGIKYRYFDFSANVDKSKWNGSFSMNFQGPLLTINANF
jgi:opacity protein-like surface antigen